MYIEQFVRKSFPVDAVRVTAENMAEVAKWCDGEIQVDTAQDNTSGNTNFIKVRVQNPLNERQTKAYVGDWVLYAGKGYKVYKDSAFRKSFLAQPQVEAQQPIGMPPTPIKPLSDNPSADAFAQNVFKESDIQTGSGGNASNSSDFQVGSSGHNPGGTHTV